MELIDLSHEINGAMPVYPGRPQPRILQSAAIKTEGYRETQLDIESHTGTHIDAPAHMLENGRFLGQFPASKFTGKAVVIKVPEGAKRITKNFLSDFENLIVGADFALFNTGWGKYWGSEKYFENFPVPEPDAAGWLISFGLKGIGFDTISADPVESQTWENHFLFFGNDMIIIENLVFPESLGTIVGQFSCFPLKIREADGSPVRAVLCVAKG